MIYEAFNNERVHSFAHRAYQSLIKEHDTSGMDHLVGYMQSLGCNHDASHNQLTFWARHSRSPLRSRIIFEMQGPQDRMLQHHAYITFSSPWYVCYYFNPDAVGALNREIQDAPDKLEDARALLKDWANDKDPALRGRSLCVDISQK